MNGTLLEVQGLSVEFPRPKGVVRAADGVSFKVACGEVVAMVGESGCGKTATALALFGLTLPPGTITCGRVLFDGVDLLALPENELRRYRGAGLAYVPQDVSEALNPVLTVGSQIVDVIRAHRPVGRREAWSQAVSALERVGVPDPERRAGEYPHQYSGGMKQRALLAMALSAGPRLLVADEPTTAVDPTLTAGLIDLLRTLVEQEQLAMLLISHDLGGVAALADRVLVMYAGRLVEESPVDLFFEQPLHPYSRGLLASIPGEQARDGRLPVIPGSVPDLGALPPGCAFSSRCSWVEPACREEIPSLREAGKDRRHACRLDHWPASTSMEQTAMGRS